MKGKELLFSITKKDFIRQTFRAGGKGGQRQNKVETGVRIIHTASGAVGVSREGRSQHANQRVAFQRLLASDKFKTWHKIKSAEVSGARKTEAQLMKEVEDSMIPTNLKIENIKTEEG